MSTKYVEPDNDIKDALIATIHRIFKGHFEEWNIHPIPLGITYRSNKGEWTASIELNWQRKPDYKTGSHLANFEYVRRDPPHGRERYWYCSSGLPNN